MTSSPGTERAEPRRGVSGQSVPVGVMLSGCALVGLAVATIHWADSGRWLVSIFWRQLRDDLNVALPLAATGVLGLLWALLPARRASGLAWLCDHPRSVAALTTLICLSVSALAYQGQPLAMDEVAPVFQARVFASGKLAADFNPSQLPWLFPPGFLGVFYFVEQAGGRVISAYWPGMALLLAPFELAGIGFALNPLLAGVSSLLLRYVALHLTRGDREATGGSIALLVAAPAFIINGASFYSMNAHLCANLAFVALLLRPTTPRLVMAGAVGGLAFSLHNPLPHLLFAWPWWGLQLLERDRARRLGALLAGYLPVAALLVVGWFLFASGIRGGGAPLVGASAVVAPSAQVMVTRSLGLAKLVLWSPLGLLPLAALGFVRSSGDRLVRCLVLSALSTLLAFMFVKFDQGHGWGYRYFHSAYATLPLLGGLALAAAGPSASRTLILRSTAGWALAALVLLVPQRAWQVARHVREHRAQLAPTPPRESCVHFIWPFGDYSLDLIANRPNLRGDLYLYDHGRAKVDALLAREFPSVRRYGASSTDAVYCGSLDAYRAMALGSVNPR